MSLVVRDELTAVARMKVCGIVRNGVIHRGGVERGAGVVSRAGRRMIGRCSVAVPSAAATEPAAPVTHSTAAVTATPAPAAMTTTALPKSGTC
jgi:hypothetical protein